MAECVGKMTPGPWEVTTERSSGSGQPWIFQTASGGGCRKTVFDGDAPDAWPLSKANARAIAALPDLVACLLPNSQHSVSWILRKHGYVHEANQIDAALTKLDGEGGA